MDETNVLMSYNSFTNRTTITLPCELTEAIGDENRPVNERRCIVATRLSSSKSLRGATWPIVSVPSPGSTIVVTGDARAEKIFIGLRITAERTESRFYVRSPKGLLPTTRLQVVNYLVTHALSGYYRAEVTYLTRGGTRKGVVQMDSRVVGDPRNQLGVIPITDGQLLVPVNSNNLECSIRLVNDSFLPSQWQTSEYQYKATFIAVPGLPNAGASANADTTGY
jgi:hypothetical protein